MVKIPVTSQAPGYVRRLDTSKKQQLNENSKEIQVIRENLKRKIEEYVSTTA